jgi:hypothetical protein
MRPLVFAALLAASAPSHAAQAGPNPDDELFLYNVAVFEYNGAKKGVAVPWKQFGEPIPLSEEVHKKTAAGTVDTRSVRQLKILDVAKYLRSTNGASLVANVPARPGDLIRAPCGLGTNLELDFSGAAPQAGKPSSLLVKVLELSRETPQGTEFIGALTGAGGAVVDQTTGKFPTVEGDTFVVEVSRTRQPREAHGCVVLVTP